MWITELLIDLSVRQLCVRNIQTLEIHECFPVAVGKASTPTPDGVYNVEGIHPYPELISFKTGRNLGRGILGSFAITLGENRNIPGGTLAIHGTNQPELIGLTISHGCVRMTNKDIEKLVMNYYFNSVQIRL